MFNLIDCDKWIRSGTAYFKTDGNRGVNLADLEEQHEKDLEKSIEIDDNHLTSAGPTAEKSFKPFFNQPIMEIPIAIWVFYLAFLVLILYAGAMCYWLITTGLKVIRKKCNSKKEAEEAGNEEAEGVSLYEGKYYKVNNNLCISIIFMFPIL